MTFELDISGLNKKFSANVCSLDIKTDQDDFPFSAEFDGIELGDVNLFKYNGPNLCAGSRGTNHIATDPLDNFLFLLPLNFPFGISQLRNETMVEPGNFTLVSTMKPWDSFMEIPRNSSQSEFILNIPGNLLRQQVPHIDNCCAMSVTAERGAGRILKSLIQSSFLEGRRLSATQAMRFGSMLINAIGIAALDAPEFTDQTSSRSELAYARIRANALQFIESNLSNPLLDAALVAEYCHVSLRRLYAAFESSSITVGALIRKQRLDRCKADLLNPELRGQSIIQIAMKWGYSCSATFARAYHAHFGKSPSEERQSAPARH